MPSEILRLNRFSTRMLFPGQVVYVPDPNYVPPSPTLPPDDLSPLQAATPATPARNQKNIEKARSQDDEAAGKSSANASTPVSSSEISHKQSRDILYYN